MNIIPKADLVHGAYYEGFHDEEQHETVARWNADDNKFEFIMDHHWTSPLIGVAYYWDEVGEYFGPFEPTMKVEPKDYEKVGEYL